MLAPGSPFQFLSPGEQLAPLMKDVKVAQITYDPHYYGPGRGLFCSVLDNLNGRVHRRLCPFVEINFSRAPLDGPARMKLNYGEVEKEFVLDHPNIRLLMKDVYDFRQEQALMRAAEESLTTYQEITIDDQVQESAPKKTKKPVKKK